MLQRAEPQDFERVLSSMCTVPHPSAREAAERFLATNPGDPGTYETIAGLDVRPSKSRRRRRVRPRVRRLGRERRRVRRYARSEPRRHGRPERGCARQRTSPSKAADVLGVELRTAPAADYRVNMAAMAELVDEDTVCVVGVAGSTEYGYVDPIPAIADLAETVDALCHVDAAWGGFSSRSPTTTGTSATRPSTR